MPAPHLYSLVYRSRATRLFSDAELVELLRSARPQNERLEITGLLLYCDGQFIQVLEGNEDDVIDLYQKISRDPRHTGVTLLNQGPIATRSMATWSMGFRQTSPAEIEALPGFSDFLDGWDDLPELAQPEDWSARLLRLFKSSV